MTHLKMKENSKMGGFLPILLGTLATTILENMLGEKPNILHES